MKLTPYRRVMLILIKALDVAETGGMAPEDCGAIYQALEACFVASDGNVEETMQSLIDQISGIIEMKTLDEAVERMGL